MLNVMSRSHSRVIVGSGNAIAWIVREWTGWNCWKGFMKKGPSDALTIHTLGRHKSQWSDNGYQQLYDHLMLGEENLILGVVNNLGMMLCSIYPGANILLDFTGYWFKFFTTACKKLFKFIIKRIQAGT